MLLSVYLKIVKLNPYKERRSRELFIYFYGVMECNLRILINKLLNKTTT